MDVDPGTEGSGTAASLAPPSSRPDSPEGTALGEAIVSLRRGAAAVDRLWHEARSEPDLSGLTVTLGEASHALHRGLMVLDDPHPVLILDGPSPAASGTVRAPIPVAAPLEGTDSGLAAEVATALVELGPDGVVVVDEDGLILFANGRAESIFGYDRGALAGLTVEELVPDPHQLEHLGHRREYYETPRTRPMGVRPDLSARRADGSEVPVQISLAAAHLAGRVCTMAVVREVSEHRAAEKAARQALLAEDEARIAIELHNVVIERLFNAGMGVQGVLRLADGALATRLREVVDELDMAVRAIRDSVFNRFSETKPRGGSRA